MGSGVHYFYPLYSDLFQLDWMTLVECQAPICALDCRWKFCSALSDTPSFLYMGYFVTINDLFALSMLKAIFLVCPLTKIAPISTMQTQIHSPNSRRPLLLLSIHEQSTKNSSLFQRIGKTWEMACDC